MNTDSQPNIGHFASPEEDIFNEVSQADFATLCKELKDLPPDKTYIIPVENYEQGERMRGLMHGVSKKLGWKAVRHGSRITSYLITIKFNSLYVKRLA